METVSFGGSHSIQWEFFQWKPFCLFKVFPFRGIVEAIPFNRSCSCQWKPFRFSVEVVSRSHSLEWKPFLLVEAYPFNGSRSSQWTSVCLSEVVSLRGIGFLVEVLGRSHSLEWKPFLLVKACPFNGSCSSQWKSIRLSEVVPFQWKPLFLVEINHFYFFSHQTAFSLK